MTDILMLFMALGAVGLALFMVVAVVDLALFVVIGGPVWLLLAAVNRHRTGKWV